MKKSRSFKTRKQYLGDGGVAKGPAHEEGGINAEKSGKPVAEIEGQERVFSKEDTEYMEQEAEKIQTYTQSGDIPGADKCAQEFGYRVAQMITKQDMNEAKNEVETSAINDFSNGGYEE
jgi:hypothetical protein